VELFVYSPFYNFMSWTGAVLQEAGKDREMEHAESLTFWNEYRILFLIPEG
jgi:hypothetical protein